MKISEHVRAVRFFAIYSNDVPEYRIHLLSSKGIPLLVKHLKSLLAQIEDSGASQDLYDVCLVCSQVSAFSWCAAMLVQCVYVLL